MITVKQFTLFPMLFLVCIQTSNTGKGMIVFRAFHALHMQMHMNFHPGCRNCSVLTMLAANLMSPVLVCCVATEFPQVVKFGVTLCTLIGMFQRVLRLHMPFKC